MCGHHGRRRHHQPLFVKAAVAGGALAVSSYEKHKQKSQQQQVSDRAAYPDTLNAPNQQYDTVPTVPPYADANVVYSERDEKRDPALAHEAIPSDPPAYEDVARAPMPATEPMPSGEVPRAVDPVPAASHTPYGQERYVAGYPSEAHSSKRPKPKRRGSSASSVSSISSASSVSGNEYETHARNFLPGNARPMIHPNMNSKKAAKHGRKHLKRALKNSKSMDDAALTVLGAMSTLFRVDPNHMRTFSACEVDPSTAMILSEWARKSAKSRVSVQELVQAGNFTEASRVIASRSRKVKLWKKRNH